MRMRVDGLLPRVSGEVRVEALAEDRVRVSTQDIRRADGFWDGGYELTICGHRRAAFICEVTRTNEGWKVVTPNPLNSFNGPHATRGMMKELAELVAEKFYQENPQEMLAAGKKYVQAAIEHLEKGIDERQRELAALKTDLMGMRMRLSMMEVLTKAQPVVSS